MKHFEFEYGAGTMGADLPASTDVFIPDVTVPDPPCIPEEQLEAAYRESLRHPIGMPPLSELAFPGAKVVFVIPDRVKGGEQPTSHRKLAVKYILEELYAKGVRKEDILFIISNGLHPVRRRQTRRQSSGRNCITPSGPPGRSSATTRRTRPIWSTSASPGGGTRSG